LKWLTQGSGKTGSREERMKPHGKVGRLPSTKISKPEEHKHANKDT